MKRIHSQSGLTLVELLVAISILAILVSLAVPNMSDSAQRSAIKAEHRNYLGGLHYARNEAITRNKLISICPSVNSVNCDGTSNDWSFGFIVFIDNGAGTNYGNGVLDSDEELLLTHQSESQTQINITDTTNTELNSLSWNYQGFMQHDTQAIVLICHQNDTSSKHARGLYVDLTGRVITLNDSNTGEGTGVLYSSLNCSST